MSANKSVDLKPETLRKIENAIIDILEGNCTRADISKNVKVYECKNIIRIDLKVVEEV
jgi:hypothetical protein